MLDRFLGDAIAASPALTGVAVEQGNDASARLVVEASELGRRLPVDIKFDRDVDITVLSLQATRSVEYEQELSTEILQQGLDELRRRWPEIFVRVRNTQSGIDISFETKLVGCGGVALMNDGDFAINFRKVLLRLRTCIVRSFHFINLLCGAARVDIQLLETGNDFPVNEWAIVQDCGGVDTLRQSIDALCEELDGVGRDKVLARALEWIRAEKSAAERRMEIAASEHTAPVKRAARADGSAVPIAALGPIGLTLEEFLSYGP